MAYCEWHQEIRNHWKTDDLMRRLSLLRWQALGILGSITSWAIGHRPGGIIEKKLIPVAVEWTGDPDQLLSALIGAGWLDEFDEDRVEVHDWEDITQGYRKARKDAARKRRERADRVKAKSKHGRGNSKERPRTLSVKKQAKTVHGHSKERRSEQNEQNEQNERTRAAPPPPKSNNNHSQTPSSGSSRGTTGPELGAVVAVSDRKAQESGEKQSPEHAAALRDRVLNQASIRLGTPILEAVGVDPQVAVTLARAHPTVRILHVCEHAKKQENPGGFARAALEQGWTVPDSNGAGLAKLIAAIEAEVVANEAKWRGMGGSSGRQAADYPQRREGEEERAYTARVNEWMKSKQTGGQQ